jgi:DNA-binding NtrC family response regulator
VRALQECDGNVSAASRYLGVPHTTLKHKIQRHGIRELALTARGGVPQRPRVD